MPKKILIFSLSYYPDLVSGAEAAIREITDRIDPADIVFELVTLRYDSRLPKRETIGNVLVRRIGFTSQAPSLADLRRFPLRLNKPLYQFLAAFTALRLHRRHGYDAIWAMMAHSAGVPAAIFKLIHPRVPYILSLQEGDPPEYIERVMRPLWPLFSRAFTSANIVQAISGFLGDWAKRRGFAGPLELIPNGGNPGDFKAEFSEAELRAARERTGREPGMIDLITTSRLVEKNGVDDVIRALPLLPAKVRFIVVGGGPEETALRGLCTELKVSDRVKFLGQIEREAVPKFRKVADIFVRPSRSEGLGNAILSAMAARLPVIATQEGGIADFLFDAQRDPGRITTGWAVDKNSPEQIAAAVKEIMSDPDRTRTVTAAAYVMVKEKYDWDVLVKAMRDRVFGKVL